MDYNMVKEICRVNKISLQDLATEIGMSPEGLKRSMESDSLAARYVVPLCKSLCISPNKLFGYPNLSATQTQNGGVGNTQIMESGMAALQEQLREKDKQIDKLLILLEKK